MKSTENEITGWGFGARRTREIDEEKEHTYGSELIFFCCRFFSRHLCLAQNDKRRVTVSELAAESVA